MPESTSNPEPLAASVRQFARRLLVIGENRLELLTVEVQEGRERLLRILLLALAMAVFGLLAGLTLTATIVVWLWPWSHLAALAALTCLYSAAGALLYRQMTKMMRDWQTLPASLDQLRKDRECLEEIIG